MSADKLPGLGADEFLNSGENYSELAKIKDWRKMLSNFWPCDELIIDGKKWYSVEQYFHAMKFMRDFPEFAETFTLNSGSQWSKDPAMSKAIGGKTGKWKGVQVRPIGVTMRSDFYGDFHKILN